MNTDQTVNEIVEAVKRYVHKCGPIWETEGTALEEFKEELESILFDRSDPRPR